MILSPHSQTFLPGLRPEIVKVIQRAAELTSPDLQWIITQGLRTAETEFALWISCHNIDGTRNDGAWKTNCNGYPVGTMTPHGIPGTGESNHQHGQAIDFAVMVDGKCVWNDLALYQRVADVFLQAGAEVNIGMEYGGTWPAPKTDSDHVQLNARLFPI